MNNKENYPKKLGKNQETKLPHDPPKNVFLAKTNNVIFTRRYSKGPQSLGTLT